MIDPDRIADDVMMRVWAHVAPVLKAELLNMYNAGYRARMAHEAQDKAGQFAPLGCGPATFGPVAAGPIVNGRVIPFDPAKESG